MMDLSSNDKKDTAQLAAIAISFFSPQSVVIVYEKKNINGLIIKEIIEKIQ